LAGDSESEDIVTHLNRMETLVLTKIKKPAQVRKKIMPDGKHNEALWAKQFAVAYL